ncbi:S8/S53 family peptidase [uncultured Microscilla sp.]|uniref:S8 family peptidase n=1 Tax=uncultured Microscilla sp. TaxID=432653 RepID=UPI002622774F|nr:S8/S53 family peptidase [uncultured Microscilla sp.]
MKKLIILYCLLLMYGGVAHAQECYPNREGKHQYYLNMQAEVAKTFNKATLISLLSQSKAASKTSLETIEAAIETAAKSFPTAKTALLQKSVTMISAKDNLTEALAQYKDVFSFVEKLCFPKDMLLYEPNDFAIGGNHPKTHLELIKAPGAWDISKGDSRIAIGITDTYMDPNHDEFKNKLTLLQNSSFVDHHGVAVAGCAAADTDNGIGIAAAGFHSSIVFSSQAFNDNVVLQMAQMQGVRVINCSWINNCSHSVTQQAVYDEIRNVHNVLVVAGAGNKPTHCGDNAYVYPAAYNSVVSVTSVGHTNNVGHVNPTNGDKMNWKDCHEQTIGSVASTHHHNNKVNIAAPGYQVFTTYANNGYGYGWGTSFASPIVAGVCALVAAVNPCLTAVEIQNIVLSTADPSLYLIPENANYTGLLGTGRVDAEAAVKRAFDLGTVYVQNQTYNGTTNTETAQTMLKAGYNVDNSQPFGNVIIKSGSNVTFRATHKIVFGENFKIENNAVFKAKIYQSTCF